MFRAIKTYDGSDSSKCINLTPGDTLSEVHALDETWFIGFNERSGEIGAFPIACVETVGNEYGPLPGKVNEGHKMDENAIYANVSKQIQARKAAEAKSVDDLDPKERSRTLSTHAKSFDAKKLTGTKPEKSFRLTLVKNGDTDGANIDAVASDPDDQRRPSLLRPEEVFKLENDIKVEKDDEQHVRFSEVAIEHSISVADSVTSWQDSFEMSYETNGNDTQSNDLGKEFTKEKVEDGKWHKLKRSSIQSSTERLNRSDSANNIPKLLISVTASLVTLGLLYVALVFCFGYTFIAAGAVVGVLALLTTVALALSPLCRFTMTLLFTNILADEGRPVLLVIVFGTLLSYPILNITHNVNEVGRSLSCLTDLAVNQSQALERQLAQPYKDVANFIEKQREDLGDVSKDITGAFNSIDAQLNNFYGSLASIDSVLAEVVKECKKPFTDTVNFCASECLKEPEIKNQCLQACSLMLKISWRCDAVMDARNAEVINASAAKARSAIEKVDTYFNVDIHAVVNFNESTNTSDFGNVTRKVQGVGEIGREFETFVNVLIKLLSLLLLLLFLQSFRYARNYLSKEGFDNIYITEAFRALDSNADTDDKVLPLKEREKNIYIDTSCLTLRQTELAYCVYGLLQVLMYMFVCVFVLLFDYGLCCVLTVANDNGYNGMNSFHSNAFHVNVAGDSHLVQYYRTMLKAINLQKYFTMSLNVTMCLPRPMATPVSIVPVLGVVFLIVLASVLLRGYGLRLRRTVAAYFYPEQERARLEYLHTDIHLQRKSFMNSLSLQIQSSHRELFAKRKYSISFRMINNLSRIERCFPAVGRCIPKLTKLECSGCKQRERVSRVTTLKKCRGEHGGALCEAVYCEDCRQALDNRCPICLKDETFLKE